MSYKNVKNISTRSNFEEIRSCITSKKYELKRKKSPFLNLMV
jgi:hypothetical protein